MSNALINFTPDNNDDSSEFNFDAGIDTSFLDGSADADNDFICIVTDNDEPPQITVRFALKVTIDELEKARNAFDAGNFKLARSVIDDLLSGAKDLMENLEVDQ